MFVVNILLCLWLRSGGNMAPVLRELILQK